MNPTHEVFNQPAALSDYNLFATNRPLLAALNFTAPALDTVDLSPLAVALGIERMIREGRGEIAWSKDLPWSVPSA